MNVKGSGLLGKWKSVDCPTCEAPAGMNCVTVGARGTLKGQEMSTSVHNARKALATGGEVVDGKVYKFKPTRKVTIASLKAKPKAGRPTKKSLAAKKAWATKRAKQAKKERIDEKFYEAARETQARPTISLIGLIEKNLELLKLGAKSVSLNLEGVGQVHGECHSTTDQRHWFKLEVYQP